MRRLAIGKAGEEPDGIAPDGIPIHLVLCGFHTSGQSSAMGTMRFLSVAEGRVEPGQCGVHAHCSLEQVSYVLEGEVLVQMRDVAGGEVRSVALRQGQALVTLPTQTLSFANASGSAARVLFVCAPPYPADDRDTLLLRGASRPGAPPATSAELSEMHRELTHEELERAIAQQERMQAEIGRVFEERIAALRALLAGRGPPSRAETPCLQPEEPR